MPSRELAGFSSQPRLPAGHWRSLPRLGLFVEAGKAQLLEPLVGHAPRLDEERLDPGLPVNRERVDSGELSQPEGLKEPGKGSWIVRQEDGESAPLLHRLGRPVNEPESELRRIGISNAGFCYVEETAAETGHFRPGLLDVHFFRVLHGREFFLCRSSRTGSRPNVPNGTAGRQGR